MIRNIKNFTLMLLPAACVYALAWGSALVVSSYYPYQHLLSDSFSAAPVFDKMAEIAFTALYILLAVIPSSLLGLLFSILHLALMTLIGLAGKTTSSNLPIISIIVGLGIGLLTFIKLRMLDTILIVDFAYYAPTYAAPVFISSVFASIISGLFLSRRLICTSQAKETAPEKNVWPPEIRMDPKE